MNTVLIVNVQLSDNIYQHPTILSSFRFTPMTSVDVEQSFSAVFKNMLTNRRQFHGRKTGYMVYFNFNNK